MKIEQVLEAATALNQRWRETMQFGDFSRRHSRASAPRLTEREREIMRWTADGKTSYEIGMIVGLSERTVNFHINRVLAKLDAANKTQAAVKAAVMGLLFDEAEVAHLQPK